MCSLPNNLAINNPVSQFHHDLSMTTLVEMGHRVMNNNIYLLELTHAICFAHLGWVYLLISL